MVPVPGGGAEERGGPLDRHRSRQAQDAMEAAPEDVGGPTALDKGLPPDGKLGGGNTQYRDREDKASAPSKGQLGERGPLPHGG